MANLAVKKEEQDQAARDSRVFAINAEMKSLTAKIDRLERRAAQHSIPYDNNNKFWKDIEESENRLGELEKKLAKISSSPDRQEVKRSHELISNLMDDNNAPKKIVPIPIIINSGSHTPESRITMESTSVHVLSKSTSTCTDYVSDTENMNPNGNPFASVLR